MNIIESDRYQRELREITLHIKEDKKSAAIHFAKGLKSVVGNLTIFPYKYRKSIYFESNEIRDMIFNGHTIIYEINSLNDTIEILTIFNKNKFIN